MTLRARSSCLRRQPRRSGGRAFQTSFRREAESRTGRSAHRNTDLQVKLWKTQPEEREYDNPLTERKYIAKLKKRKASRERNWNQNKSNTTNRNKDISYYYRFIENKGDRHHWIGL